MGVTDFSSIDGKCGF